MTTMALIVSPGALHYRPTYAYFPLSNIDAQHNVQQREGRRLTGG